MTRLLLALPALALTAACATGQRPYVPVQNIRYQALGAEPFWLLTIGDDRIVLRFGHARGEQAEPQDEHVFPRTLPRTVDGVRSWQSGEGLNTISIRARPGPCTGAAGRRYEDHVDVELLPLVLTGCGGRQLRGEER